MRIHTRLLPFALLALSASCYSLVPTVAGAPTVGRDLVYQLSDRGRLDLGSQLGNDLESVSGRVLSFENGSYELAVSQTTNRAGLETTWRGERTLLQSDYVVGVAERRLDRKRSWTVAGVAAVGVVLAGRAFGIDNPLGAIFGKGGGTRQ